MEDKGVPDVYDGDEASTSVTKDCLTFSQLSHFTRKLGVVLGEFKENKIMESSPIRKAVESLETELKRAKALVASPRMIRHLNPLIDLEKRLYTVGKSLNVNNQL